MLDNYARGGLLAQDEIAFADSAETLFTATVPTEITRIQIVTAAGDLDIYHDDTGGTTADATTQIFDALNDHWASPGAGSGIFVNTGGKILVDANTGNVSVALYGITSSGLAEPAV